MESFNNDNLNLLTYFKLVNNFDNLYWYKKGRKTF